MADAVADWSRQVTVVLTYDPDTDDVWVDRGALGKLLARAIVLHAGEEGLWLDDATGVRADGWAEAECEDEAED